MKFFNFKKSEPTTPIQTESYTSANDFHLLSDVTEFPKAKEERNSEFVKYGTDNDYPTFLKELYTSSPTHGSILRTKSMLTAGDLEFDSELYSKKDKVILFALVEQINKQKEQISVDFQMFGAVALEIIWNLDFSKIIKINRIDPAYIRTGKFVDGEIQCYYYKRNWSDTRDRTKPQMIMPFNPQDKENGRQLLYIGQSKIVNEYYYEPSYISGANWISLESEIGIFYKSLIANSFNPSLAIKIYRKPKNEEEKNAIVRGLNRMFKGATNAGKSIILFSDGKELAPDINPIETSNLDKQFTVLADQITTKILTSSRVTTPELCGIAIPGSLGSSDFEAKMEIFEKYVIEPDRKFLQGVYNQILNAIGYSVDLKIKKLY